MLGLNDDGKAGFFPVKMFLSNAQIKKHKLCNAVVFRPSYKIPWLNLKVLNEDTKQPLKQDGQFVYLQRHGARVIVKKEYC